MELTQAINAWVDAHGANLSTSTQRDIKDIRAAVRSSGWGELPCEEVDDGVREDVIYEATQRGTLSGSAISEFFDVVLNWEATQEEAADLDPEDGLGPSGLFQPNADSLGDDEDHDDDDDVDDDDYDDDDDDDDDYDDEDDDDDDDDYDDDVDDDDYDDDDDVDDYDSDDVDDDDYDDDDDVDEEVSEPVDPDDWVGYLGTAQDGDDFTGLSPENESPLPVDDDAPADEEAAASSFFNAIDSSTPLDEQDSDTEPVVIVEDATPDKKGGVFSAAAEEVPRAPASGIDWITVAYFAVAAVCFALVIYFYLTSS